MKKKEIEVAADQLSDMVLDLDVKLNSVLKRQEQEYLRGYSIYVREKERELRDLVNKLNERNSNNSVKDEIIYALKQTIKKNYETAI